MRRYSYIVVAFIILIFGIIVVPRIVTRIQEADRVDTTRLSAQMPLAFIELNGEAKRVPREPLASPSGVESHTNMNTIGNSMSLLQVLLFS